MTLAPRPLSDDKYLIIYRQPSYAPGDPVPLTPREFQGGYHIVDVDLVGFGDCALPGQEKPLTFGARVAAEAFLQRCYKIWGLRPRRGEDVPLIA